VTVGNFTGVSTSAKPSMASIFFCAKVLAIVLQPMAIKGAFTTLIRIYSGMPVMAELSRDIPLALPSVIHWAKKIL